MNDAEKYQRMFEEATSSREVLKSFSEALAKAEAELNLKPKKILVNGIVRDDSLMATFDVQKSDMTKLMEHFLNNTKLNPDIIVNGMPPNELREISINVGRRFGP